MKVLLWNTEWSPNEWRCTFVRTFFDRENPDLICVTQGIAKVFEGLPNVICSSEDFGYPNENGKRKVWLASR